MLDLPAARELLDDEHRVEHELHLARAHGRGAFEGEDHAHVLGVVVGLYAQRPRDHRQWRSVGMGRIRTRGVDDDGARRGRPRIATCGSVRSDQDALDCWHPCLLPQPPPSTAALLTSRIALVMLMPRGHASTQLKIVRQRHTPSLSARISSRSPAASSRESKMKRCAFTIAAGPTYDFCAQNDGHELVHAAHRMHLVVSSYRSRSACVWSRSASAGGSSLAVRNGITLRYLAKKSSMSTTRSLTTGSPGSGATEILRQSWS